MNFKNSQLLLKRKLEAAKKPLGNGNGKVPAQIIIPVSPLGEIGCGSVVPFPFAPSSDLAYVVVPEGTSPADIATLTVRGISLSDMGILDGDLLIVRRKFTWRQIKPDTICAIYIHSTGELCAKKIVRGVNTLLLRSTGGNIPDKEVSPDDIEIKGIVFAVQRPIDGFVEIPF